MRSDHPASKEAFATTLYLLRFQKRQIANENENANETASPFLNRYCFKSRVSCSTIMLQVSARYSFSDASRSLSYTAPSGSYSYIPKFPHISPVCVSRMQSWSTIASIAFIELRRQNENRLHDFSSTLYFAQIK